MVYTVCTLVMLLYCMYLHQSCHVHQSCCGTDCMYTTYAVILYIALYILACVSVCIVTVTEIFHSPVRIEMVTGVRVYQVYPENSQKYSFIFQSLIFCSFSDLMFHQ